MRKNTFTIIVYYLTTTRKQRAEREARERAKRNFEYFFNLNRGIFNK